MSEHPIEGLMLTAMNSIRDMVDVNTIVGDAIEAPNGTIIIPISKVTFGFAAGGSEFKGETINEYAKRDKEETVQYKLPFGGGSGAAVNINPQAFLVVQDGNIKLLPINYASAIDKLIDYVPDLMEKVNNVLNKVMSKKDCENKKDISEEVEEIKKKIKEKTKDIENEYIINDENNEVEYRNFDTDINE